MLKVAKICVLYVVYLLHVWKWNDDDDDDDDDKDDDAENVSKWSTRPSHAVHIVVKLFSFPKLYFVNFKLGRPNSIKSISIFEIFKTFRKD